MGLHLVVGLGNPGPRYAETRHNVGFRVADTLGDRWGSGPWHECGGCLVSLQGGTDHRVVLAKPQTFMNRSGLAVAGLLERWEVGLDAVVVIHDDLDLPFGALRVRIGGGHGGHNGVRSVVESVGGGDFARLKIGIGRPSSREEVVDYVLSPFDSDQASGLPAVIDRAADAAQAILTEGALAAMNRFHA